MEKNKLYTILQLCDSAFPTGGFSHSMGTEAATQNLYINDFGSSCIPFVRAAYENANNLQKVMLLDSIHNATLLNHVAHRASKLQGKSFLTTSCKVFKLPLMEKLKDFADDEKVHCHLSIVFATVCAALNIPSLEVGKMYLFNCLRTIIASIVRLGKVGTIQAQHLQFEIQCCLDDILKRNWSLHPEESCISYPLTETLQNSHDTMFSKLFFS